MKRLIAGVRRNLPGGLLTLVSAVVVGLGGNVVPTAPTPGLWIVGVGVTLLVAGVLATPGVRGLLDRTFGLDLTPDATRTLIALFGVLAVTLTVAFLAGNPDVVSDPTSLIGSTARVRTP
ncbi:hypothetical protein [Salinirubrum litoreum]|uniref:Uncharacterized protein n=1 Tax=Salinirubrum litoreum TaxID=1126234 RepID=A0ABD5R9E1_9EURY|nr:hypothetical protein [Salinirubrum litoreum]